MKRKGMSELEIGQRLKAGKEFEVATERERKGALTAAKFLGVEICTRKTETGAYLVRFLKT